MSTRVLQAARSAVLAMVLAALVGTVGDLGLAQRILRVARHSPGVNRSSHNAVSREL